jgi:HEAT repeat protein
LALVAAVVGCRSPILDPSQAPAPLAKDPPAGGLQSRASVLGGAAAVPATELDRAVLARADWIQAVPPRDGQPALPYHWRHPCLEDLLSRPAGHRVDLRPLLADKDPIVAGNAAIGLARFGDPVGSMRLAATVRAPQLRLAMRCAAVEALASLDAAEVLPMLRELIDQYGTIKRAAVGITAAPSTYVAELHAELVRGLARHVDAASDPRLSAALHNAPPLVLVEALHAWAASRSGQLPVSVADLRSHGDARVRAAALQTLVARRHAQAGQFLIEALHDNELQVRFAAIGGLGVLGDAASQAKLKELMKDRIDGVRAVAVQALARAGAREAVLEAAGDTSWRVRVQVAAALAAYSGREATAVAAKLLDDRSVEVQRTTVAMLAQWPLERAGPLLLAGMGKTAFLTRKNSAEALSSRWPAAGEFPIEGPPPRRQEVLQRLQLRFQEQFSSLDRQALRQALAGRSPPAGPTPEQLDRAAGLLQRQDLQGLKDFGPGLVAALEQLAIDRHQTLPEAVYREVLPHDQPVFGVLARLASEKVVERRRAAEELAASAQKAPLSRLAVNRLAQQVAAEPDPQVWENVLLAVACDSGEPARRLACAAISHRVDEVRRRACQHFASHPDPACVSVLLPALQDPSQPVVIGALRALGAIGRIDDPQPVRQLLRSDNEEVQLEAAAALVRLGDPSGAPAVERMAYSQSFETRAAAARRMGELADPSFTAALLRLLDDPRVTVSRAALLSLPKVVGRDVAQATDGSPVGTAEQIRRWKQWYAEGGKK